MSNIKFKPYSNCHPGEYWAIFINSEEVKYPHGEREILSTGWKVLGLFLFLRYLSIVSNTISL